MTQQLDIRPSPIAGRWYPGDPGHLAQEVNNLLDEARQVEVPGQIIGLVAPHAGYMYSGLVAACAFRLVRGMAFERVVVLSPMHHPYRAPILTTAHQAYSTPLGTVRVDHQILERLKEHVAIESVRHDAEHALEIELPFLQQALSAPFVLVPLMLRAQSYKVAEELGRSIAKVIGKADGTLLVASSDLSHYYSQPKAHEFDQVMLSQIAAFDAEGVIRVEDEGRGFACGRAAIATMLVAARALGASAVKIVGYATSGDVTGEMHQVVGYGAAVVYRPF